MSIEVLLSAFRTDLRRYGRSRGLWIVLLAAPIAARTLAEGSWIHVAVEGRLPVMTSPTLGATLGIVVATMLWPIAFVYLRSSTTRRQPWQLNEVTAASRVALAVGHFGADVAVLLLALLVLSCAGLMLALFVASGPVQPWVITSTLWLIAAPALMLVAAQRALLDAVPATRGALGDVAAFMLWMMALTIPATVIGRPASFSTNMVDAAGYYRPLAGHDFAIGGGRLLPGRTRLDVQSQMSAGGYEESRIAWGLIAIVLAGLAGVLHRPHTTRGRFTPGSAPSLSPGVPAPSAPLPVDAPRARLPAAVLIASEFRLIGGGRRFVLLAVATALAGLFGDYRHLGSPAAVLLLVFGLTRHAGRAEARGLLPLVRITSFPPIARRLAFGVAGLSWSLILAVPASLIRADPQPILLALATGAIASVITIVLAAVSRSAFAPRLVLLTAWYAYLAS